MEISHQARLPVVYGEGGREGALDVDSEIIISLEMFILGEAMIWAAHSYANV